MWKFNSLEGSFLQSTLRGLAFYSLHPDLQKSEETMEITSRKKSRNMDTQYQRFATISRPLFPGLRTFNQHKILPPQIFPFEEEGSRKHNCGCDSIWAGGGAGEGELWHLAQVTQEEGRGCGAGRVCLLHLLNLGDYTPLLLFLPSASPGFSGVLQHPVILPALRK